jgi:hypothetical protein
LCLRTRNCEPLVLISEFHDSKYAWHFGMSRTPVAIGCMFWWKSLAGDVAKFVSTQCVACQRNKTRRLKPYGLLQPLPVPEKPWHTVTFDFIVKLPKTSRGNDSIYVFLLTSSLSWFTLWLARKKYLRGNSPVNSTSTMFFVFMG